MGLFLTLPIVQRCIVSIYRGKLSCEINMWRKWTLACLNKHNSLLRLRRSDNHVQTHAPLATLWKNYKTLDYIIKEQRGNKF